MKSNEISKLPRKPAGKELTTRQGELNLVDRQIEVDGIGMGVLKDGTPFLTGRGLARLVGTENLHIRTISQEWNEDPLKPRVAGIKAILEKRGITVPSAHIETSYGSQAIHAYPDYVCLAVLEFYAFDAPNLRETARDNYRLLAGKALQDLIYSQVGYDPSGSNVHKFEKWHERLALNYQSAPRGYFHVFNEAHTIFYELIQAGADINEKFVVDISIGSHWGRYWSDNNLDFIHGPRLKYPHRYPDTHPQAQANPHESWCYPLAALGDYREWMQSTYIEGEKFKTYLYGKVKRLEMPPSVAQLAVEVLDTKRIGAS